MHKGEKTEKEIMHVKKKFMTINTKKKHIYNGKKNELKTK